MSGEFCFLLFNELAGASWVVPSTENAPTTPLAYNSVCLDMLRIADFLARPGSVFKAGAAGAQYASALYRGGLGEDIDEKYAGKQAPVVGLLSLRSNLPADWLTGPLAPSQATRESDARMWGMALLYQLDLLCKYWAFAPVAPKTGGLVGAGAFEGEAVVAVPSQLESLFAPSRPLKGSATDDRKVTFRSPFESRCDLAWEVYAAAAAYASRLGAYYLTSQSPAPLGVESDASTRARALDMASRMQGVIKSANRAGIMRGVGALVASAAVAAAANGSRVVRMIG